MTHKDLRRRFIEFFKSPPRNHAEIPSASLVPENDPTSLFTSSGMQPLITYLLGEKHPLGTRLVNSQKCFRSQDIEEIGDNRHTTFFEMLGNWSLGDYFKKEQLSWNFEFLTRELGLDPKRLFVTVFEGNPSVLKDRVSIDIWKEIFSGVGIDAKEGERIFAYPAKKNWWSRSGEPENMPPGEPGGPDSEVFFDFGIELKMHEHSPFKNKKCHPNCDCGRFLEIANSVFMQYQKQTDGSLKELPNKNVDFGGGLERMVAAANNNPDLFQSDFFLEAIRSLEAIRKSGDVYVKDPKPYRIIVDHLRAAIFMIADGVEPSNKERGYVLRRLIRRIIVHSRKLGMVGNEWLSNTCNQLILPYHKVYPNVAQRSSVINEALIQEVDKFRKTTEEGIKALKKIYGRAIGGVDPELPKGMKTSGNVIRVDGNEVFRIYETHGLTPEISQEIMTDWGLAFDEETMKECRAAMQRHQQQSRTTASGMFKGGLANHSAEVVKLHTTTHLLQQALRIVLGNHVRQKGSHITAERLRFDFSHPHKLTPEEIKKVEDLVNEKIKQNLPVEMKIMDFNEVIKEGALTVPDAKYPEKVKVYSIDNFSKEVCGGPHVNFTGSLGTFKIIKEEAVGKEFRRIYAILRR